VLHGGSGIPLHTRRKLASESRISKFNIGTELRMAFGAALRKSMADQPHSFDRIELLHNTIPAVRKETIDIIKALRFPSTA
jgi:fructose-bisphosphate aldolase, class II